MWLWGRTLTLARFLYRTGVANPEKANPAKAGGAKFRVLDRSYLRQIRTAEPPTTGVFLMVVLGPSSNRV